MTYVSKVGGEFVRIFMYADDIVIIAEITGKFRLY